MNERLSIDVIICTYNNASSLDNALEAITCQEVSSSTDWSVLVVDNNCTDSTAAVVDKHVVARHIPGLRRIFEARQGLTFARLCGVENTTAEWIAFVDDDCLLANDWVQQAATFARRHPESGAFGGRVVLDWQAPPPAYVLKYAYAFAEQEYGQAPRQLPCLVGAGLVVRRSALCRTGWTRKQFMTDRRGTRLISGGDVELALRLGSEHELWYTPACALRHVIPPWRTSTAYLLRMNYGLGISQVFGDSMLWSGSYPHWIALSASGTVRPSVHVLVNLARVFLRRAAAADAAIRSSFVLGRWAGIARLLRMERRERRALLGCAALRRSLRQTSP